MANLKQQLPPMNSLITFEAAARHLSFTLAAHELNVTQAAVSRQIKTLESSIHCPLFIRYNRHLTLTAQGLQLLPKVQTALKLIVDSINDLKVDNTSETVTISATIAFTTLKLNNWLIDFQKLNPEIEVRVIATDRDINLEKEAIDIVIGCGDYGQNPRLDTTLLFNDEVTPVCSSQYLLENPDILVAKDLLNHHLLHLDDDHWRDLSWQPMDWKIWLESQNVSPPNQIRGLKMNNYPLLLEAVKKGQGIALGWRHLVEDLIDSGELIVPLKASLKSQRAYYLVQSSHSQSNSVMLLSDWIKRCAGLADVS